MSTLIFSDRRRFRVIGLAMITTMPGQRMVATRSPPLNHFGNKMTPGISSSPLRLLTYGLRKTGSDKSAFVNFSLKDTAEKEQLVISHMILLTTSIFKLVPVIGRWQKNPPRIRRSAICTHEGIAHRVMSANSGMRSQWIHGLRGVTMRLVAMLILCRCHTPSCSIAGASQ
jgi:hypothetical protein